MGRRCPRVSRFEHPGGFASAVCFAAHSPAKAMDFAVSPLVGSLGRSFNLARQRLALFRNPNEMNGSKDCPRRGSRIEPRRGSMGLLVGPGTLFAAQEGENPVASPVPTIPPMTGPPTIDLRKVLGHSLLMCAAGGKRDGTACIHRMAGE